LHSGDLALIFDMDGVVIDSTATHTEAWRRYLSSHGREVHALESRMIGQHNDAIVRDFFGQMEMTEAEIVQHGARKEELYRSIIAPDIGSRLVPGVVQFLEANRNVPIGLASNAEAANINFILNSADIQRYFRCVVCGHDVQRPKPHPDVYLRAAGLLGMPPDACVVFEDSVVGVQAAKAAGMRVVGLATTLPALPGVDRMIQDFLDPGLDSWLRNLALL
jgi:haloacid dehalogenase superfamily, subfamily IA, variant 3 with third motif having DD or ED/haloacid dehalogenase superfamily, subfamily IA, variant 1 with third motif having Dx(3-4)D or Dx(3-4)E